MTCRNGHPRSESYRGGNGKLLCRPCERERKARYRHLHPERKAEWNVRYHYKHRRWRALDAEKARIQQRLAELEKELLNLA